MRGPGSIVGAVLLAVLMALPVAVAAAGDAETDVTEIHVVHQHTDLGAASARHMYRFEPATLVLETGGTVAFLNSLGDHTVRSQAGLWPEGADEVDIQGEARAEVTFETEGLYGITCARHGRYGMGMLIAVGDAGLSELAALDTSQLPASDMARDAYARLQAEMLADAR